VESESLDRYDRQIEIEINSDRYLVRDNGAVYRMHRPGLRRSSLDEVWTFGTIDEGSGYLRIGRHLIHRIVAFAYLGPPPSNGHVVDHIVMNRGNNRPGNLRWLTRLTNVIRHADIRRRISRAYGSLDNFFANPSSMLDDTDQSISWLKSVSREDAEKSREQLLIWGESDGGPKGRILGNRLYGTPEQPPLPIERTPDKPSQTPMAMQRRWKTPTEFPSCPEELGPDPLSAYSRSLRPGALFARDRYKESLVVTAALGEALLAVLVESREEDAVKPWAVAKVTLEEGKFVHESCGTFFELDGAYKEYCRLTGIPFDGESIDDYC
jgi:hypothetical protein